MRSDALRCRSTGRSRRRMPLWAIDRYRGCGYHLAKITVICAIVCFVDVFSKCQSHAFSVAKSSRVFSLVWWYWIFQPLDGCPLDVPTIAFSNFVHRRVTFV
jgi:hypothetical protein